jgi:membrane-associated protease RseP (regulator of RpoE activity)
MVEDHGHVFVSGAVKGTAGLWFAPDTGAARSVLDAEVGGRLGIEARERGEVGGAGGMVETRVARDVAISLPGAPLGALTLDVFPLRPISSRVGVPIALVLGYELFSRFVVELDYERGRMRLYEPAAYEPPVGAVSVPIDLVYNHPYVRASVRSRGGATVEGRYVIDLGSAQNVIFTPRSVEKFRLLEGTPTLRGEGAGIGGRVAMHTGRVSTVTVGPFTARDLVAIMPLGGVMADAEDAVGNLGGGFLRRFHVVFDYTRRRMLLTPNARFAAADEGDMSGLAIAASGEGMRELSIDRVRAGSPAAAAGLLAGDRILAVDGQELGDLPLPRLRNVLRSAGDRRLTVLRAGKRVEAVLRLRRQI